MRKTRLADIQRLKLGVDFQFYDRFLLSETLRHITGCLLKFCPLTNIRVNKVFKEFAVWVAKIIWDTKFRLAFIMIQ